MSATVLALQPRQDVEPTLALLEQVRQQLKEVQTLQKLTEICSEMKATKVYAREHEGGREIMQQAREIALEAQRQFGLIWRDAAKNAGTRGQLIGPGVIGGSDQGLPIDARPTLAELGVNRKFAARAVTLAGLPSDAFDQISNGHTTLDKLRKARPELFKAVDWKAIWRGMPSFDHEDLTPAQTILVHLQSAEDRQRLSDLLEQPLTDKTKFLWFPKQDVRHAADKRWSSAPIAPRYPIYIPTKGRWETPLTIRALERMRVPYFAVVQPQERDDYQQVVGPCGTILTLPDGLDGLVPARNWIMEHAIRAGAQRHWQIDDNIRKFRRFSDNLKRDVTTGAFFRAMEDFSDRYDNVAISGPHYDMFAPARTGAKLRPVTFNTRVYSCSLINNEIPYRYRGVYNDDTDICLRALKDEWCVILFNAFLSVKAVTMTIKGGNTDIYQGDGRREMAESLKAQHPDCVTVTKKWNRWQHQVDYRNFRDNELIPRPGAVIPDADPYGFTLATADEAWPDPEAEEAVVDDHACAANF